MDVKTVILSLWFYRVFQDEKNQVLVTNVWLEHVSQRHSHSQINYHDIVTLRYQLQLPRRLHFNVHIYDCCGLQDRFDIKQQMGMIDRL